MVCMLINILYVDRHIICQSRYCMSIDSCSQLPDRSQYGTMVLLHFHKRNLQENPLPLSTILNRLSFNLKRSMKKSTTEQTFSLPILCKNRMQHQQDLYHVCFDSDRAWHKASWSSIRKYNINTINASH